MKKIVLITLALMYIFASTAIAESVDIAAMTDEELKNLNARIESELLRRQNERSTTAVAEDDGEILYVYDGESRPKIIFESEEQLKNRLHKIELTTENWDQYLGDYYYPREYVSTNNFGEVTLRMEERSVGFGFKAGYLGLCKDVGMKFSGCSRYEMQGEWNEADDHYTFVADKWTESSEEWTFDLYSYGAENVHLEEYECLATTGVIVVLEVSPEASQWFLENPHRFSWFDIYIGETDYCDTDGLWSVYERLNP